MTVFQEILLSPECLSPVPRGMCGPLSPRLWHEGFELTCDTVFARCLQAQIVWARHGLEVGKCKSDVPFQPHKAWHPDLVVAPLFHMSKKQLSSQPRVPPVPWDNAPLQQC